MTSITAADKRLAEAVVDLLTTAQAAEPSPFTVPFTPERKRLTDLKLIDPELRVWIVAAAQQSEAGARDTDVTEYTLEIGVMKKVSRETLDAEVEDLVLFAEQLRKYLRKHDVDEFECVRASIAPTYDHDRLFKSNQFVSIVRCVYAVSEDRWDEEDDE